MRSKQWYTKTSKLSNSFANNSIGRLPGFASATRSSVRRPVESTSWRSGLGERRFSTVEKRRLDGASLRTAGRASPSGREGRARSQRYSCKQQRGRSTTRQSRISTVRSRQRRDSERRLTTTFPDYPRRWLEPSLPVPIDTGSIRIVAK